MPEVNPQFPTHTNVSTTQSQDSQFRVQQTQLVFTSFWTCQSCFVRTPWVTHGRLFPLRSCGFCTA